MIRSRMPQTLFSVVFLLASFRGEAAEKVGVAAAPAALNVISGLLLITALIFFLAWVVKRLGGGTFIQNNHMKIVASLAVGTREKLVLVEIDNKKVLIGVTPNAISQLYIANIESQSNPIHESSSVEIEKSDAKIGSDFSQFLKKLIKDGSKT